MGNESGAAQHPTLTMATVVEARSDLLCCEVERELIILDAATGTYFGLNAVGSRIWALLREPTTLAAASEALVGEFEVGATECESELYRFVAELESRGLVEIRR